MVEAKEPSCILKGTADYFTWDVITSRIKFQTELKINVKKVLNDCLFIAPEDELISEIKSIVILWAEQRLHEDGWPIPISTQEIREYLIENGLIIEFMDDND
ncbi:MAG: hypothetical protein K0S39_1824 [Paenibacillus sp.]|jgi:hypothetical protein|nr:hypothetical protein [Paenibacillus sp.]